MGMEVEPTSGKQYRLLVLGNGSVRTIPLTGSTWVVGRSPDCSITLRDPTVSRRHLHLELRGDRLQFRDLGGSNPVLLDGKPVKHGELRLGQTLAIGLTRLTLELRSHRTPRGPGTIVLDREVADPTQRSDSAFLAAAGQVLEHLTVTFADLGSLPEAAEPLLELALALTGRRRGALLRLPSEAAHLDASETLAAIGAGGADTTWHVPQAILHEARQLEQPHVLLTQESTTTQRWLVVPLGPGPRGLILAEDLRPGAATDQEVLRICEPLARLVWHRLEETAERLRLREETQQLRWHGTASFQALLASNRLHDVRLRLRSHVLADTPLLLLGECGTERDVLARYVHQESPRARAPFVGIDVTAVSEARCEQELFGGEGRLGAVQRAAGGTLFVDNLELLPPRLQRLLAEFVGRAIDSSAPRLIASVTIVGDDTAVPLDGELAAHFAGRREVVPPLRHDARDVATLAQVFLAELGPGPGDAPRLLSERAKQVLAGYTWPGNVRELRSVIDTAAAEAGAEAIGPRHLPPDLTSGGETRAQVPTLADVERRHIIDVLHRSGGNRTRAAQALGIAVSTLYEKLKRHAIDA